MNLIKTLLLSLLMVAFVSMANGQHIKPKFKQLTFVFFQPDDSTKKLKITMVSYMHIDNEGVLHTVLNMANLSNTANGDIRATFTGLRRDTTYRLDDSLIAKLNTVFNGQKKLRSYMVISKPTENTSLYVAASFISYTDQNNTTDSMIFANNFFGPDINLILTKLIFTKNARIGKSIGIFHDKILEAEIVKEHLSCKCIPAHEAPPTVKELHVK